MKKRYILLLMLVGNICRLQAQLSDSFTDNDFTSSPTWSGDAAKHEINTLQQLHLVAPPATDTAFMSTSFVPNLTADVEWRCYVKMAFSPSSTNYSKLYLMSDNPNPKWFVNGYYVKVGGITGSSDAVELYKQTGTAVTLLASGTAGHASTNPTLGIKVIRSSIGVWQLFVDTLGGSNYALEATATDASITSAAYVSLYSQYTSTRSTLFWYDDVYAGPVVVDVTAPIVVSASAINSTQVDVLFDEAPSFLSATKIINYTVSGIGNPITATVDAIDSKLIHLTFSTTFTNGINYTLNCNSITDNAGNACSTCSATFNYYTVQPNDIVINEIFPDPSPVVGLPTFEYIELVNTSTSTIDLAGWTLGDPTTTSGAMPSYLLAPDSFVTICATTALPDFALFNHVVGITSFPSLNNTSDSLFLKNAIGTPIQTLAYTDDWYLDDVKKAGGYSLELIDYNNPCATVSNWKASNAPIGGTPSQTNSIAGVISDNQAPSLLNIYPTDSLHLLLYFDDVMNETTITILTNYSLNIATINCIDAQFYNNDRSIVNITLSSPLSANQLYTLTLSNLSDCIGNSMLLNNVKSFMLPSQAEVGDLFINEILFNPSTGGVDFVEVYNASNKAFDLGTLTLCEQSTADISISIETAPMANSGFILLPYEYVCITSNIGIVQQQYTTKAPTQFVTTNDMPNYDDAESVVAIKNQAAEVIDLVHYFDDWHYALLNSKEGVSLEKIIPTATSNTQQSWKSAAESVGFATPGYANSMLTNGATSDEIVEAQPSVFSPDGDAFQDIITFNYTLDKAGYQANAYIFNTEGVQIKYLIENTTLPQSGFFSWDGLDDNGERAALGSYLIVMQYQLDNKKTKKRQASFAIATKW